MFRTALGLAPSHRRVHAVAHAHWRAAASLEARVRSARALLETWARRRSWDSGHFSPEQRDLLITELSQLACKALEAAAALARDDVDGRGLSPWFGTTVDKERLG